MISHDDSHNNMFYVVFFSLSNPRFCFFFEDSPFCVDGL
jgi:hypothetical protein